MSHSSLHGTRSVYFNDKHNRTWEYEGISLEERDDVWYCKDDYEIIRARNALIVKLMKAGRFEESDDHTFRGLEHKRKAGFHERRDNKLKAVYAVLEEQELQKRKGGLNPVAIAKLYAKMSKSSKELALQWGANDASASAGFPYVFDTDAESGHDCDDSCSVVSAQSECSITSFKPEMKKKSRSIFGFRKRFSPGKNTITL